MTVIVGQENEGSGSSAAGPGAEFAHSWKFTASATGKVTALGFKFSAAGAGTGAMLALQADEAGKPKEGVLAEGELTTQAVGAHETASLTAEPEVTSGTVYWLTLLDLGGAAKLKAGATTARRATGTKHKKVSEITAANWGVEEAKGPVSIWATGSVGETRTLAGKSTVVLAQNDAVTAEAVAMGVTAVHLTDTSALAPVAGLVSKTAVRFTQTNQPVAQGLLGGVTPVRLGQSAPVAAQTTVGGSVAVRFTDTAPLGATAKLGSKPKVKIKATAPLTGEITGRLRGTSAVYIVTAMKAAAGNSVRGGAHVSLTLHGVLLGVIGPPGDVSGDVSPRETVGVANPLF